ncbi:chorismate-binding protein [Deinococcus sp.]|uniref:chorismate-binding protein n=1 Tax=Deinococcus sp. TaxID=47478 RepID=UPI0025FAB5AA|nr:chorismate-binding protein [Deinococcus sp.]
MPTTPLSTHLASLSPVDVLLRLRTARLTGTDVSGVVLLESLGPLTDFSTHTFLSAAPVDIRRSLPDWPPGSGFFPAWLGGLKYEAAQGWGLETHPAPGPPRSGAAQGWGQHWGLYPSGLVWERRAGTLEVVGEPHLDWAALLSLTPAPAPALEVGAFTPDDLDFPAGVDAVQELIRAGEVYQVNLSRGVSAAATGDPLAAYLRLRGLNPSPFMAYAELGDEVVVSGSPERLLRWERAAGLLSARPIAGTRRRGETPEEDAALEAELRSNPKERAEHVMLLDLIRHDLGAASTAVWVPELMLVERYSHVMHLVSEVQGRARSDLSLGELLAATFPGGTITGAPKRRVMQAIRDLEPGPRSWYTGSLGRISGEGADLNILIRTAGFEPSGDGWTVSVRAGAGIVIGSQGRAETRETLHKAQATLSALGGSGGRPAQAPAPPTPGRPWQPAPARPRPALRVLLLDNFDSFTHNLAHDLRSLDAEVVLRDQTAELPELLALRPAAVLIGPGPGTPGSSGVTLALTRHCLDAGLPLLGVCLGHQALGQVLGGTVGRAALPVHGEVAQVSHGGLGLFTGLPSPTPFTRYHSLVVRGLPDAGRVTARSEDGEIMALEAVGKPAWGVQFHPESLLSTHGKALLGNWLDLCWLDLCWPERCWPELEKPELEKHRA